MEQFQDSYLWIALVVFLVMVLVWALMRSRSTTMGDSEILEKEAPKTLSRDQANPSPDDFKRTAETQAAAPAVDDKTRPTAPEPAPQVQAAAPVDTPQETAEKRPRIAAAVGEPDDLRQIKGVGPKLSALLNRLGVTRFDQIAAWGAGDIAEVDQYLETFKGRIERDNWVEQAGLLASGDIEAYEAKFGKMLKL